MTTWDNIYKDFQQGGEAWATLSEGIDEKFQEFIATNTFNLKSAFDIGCGTGKYLKYLKGLGFEVAGIDSSPTAVKMTKENLGNDVIAEVADMFKFDINAEKFDLILSISTIHHGLKHEVKNLLKQIHTKLSEDGKVFITIPDLDKAIYWNTFKDHIDLEPGTYAPNSGPEIGLAHSFYTKHKIVEMFKDYKDLKMEMDDIGRWFVIGTK